MTASKNLDLVRSIAHGPRHHETPRRGKESRRGEHADCRRRALRSALLLQYAAYSLLGVTAAVGGGGGRRRSCSAVAVAGRRLSLGRRRRPLSVVAVAA